MNTKQKKWNSAYQQADIETGTPVKVLIENDYLLHEDGGTALDLACGRAANAIFLANKKYKVDAIDYSSTVLKAVDAFAKMKHLDISCKLRDVEKEGLASKKYNVIVVSYFLDRTLFPQIIDSLEPQGLLFYQTWSQMRCDNSGPSNNQFRLEKGELLAMCADLDIILYRQNSDIGDSSKGLRNEAMLIGQKNI